MEIIKVPKFKRKFGKELVNNENAIDNRKENKNENKPKNANDNSLKNVTFKFKYKTNFQVCKIVNCDLIYLNCKCIDKMHSFNNTNFIYLNEYFNEVIKNIITTESQNIYNYRCGNLFDSQDKNSINDISRKHIIESIIYQNHLWKLNPDSAYLAINIMDRFIHLNKVKNNKYELVGAASFFIASKHEDIYSPDVQSFSKIFSYKYHYEEIICKESEILSALDFRLLYISSYKVLNLLYSISNIHNANIKNLSNMILDFSLTDLNIMKYSQIKRAISSFILANRLFGNKVDINLFKLLFGCDEKDLNKIVNNLFIILKDAILSKEQNLIAEKYKSYKFNSIFTVLENKIKDKIKKKFKKIYSE